MRIKVLACEVVFREFCLAAAKSPVTIDLEFLIRGLHDNPLTLRTEVQARIDTVDESETDAVVLGYGLCSNGTAGLVARGIPLVIPRAHDCITFFMGSKERYQEHFFEHPGTYYATSGWIERAGSRTPRLPKDGAGLDASYEEMVEKYGEDNAQYLWEFQASWIKNYTHSTYIDMGTVGSEEYRRRAEERAAELGWQFSEMQGDWRLIDRLLGGEWDDADFLTVPPGHTVVQDVTQGIIRAEKA